MKIDQILVLHHSHLDIGYTHSQPILWEMQREYMDLALDFLDATAGYPDHSLPRWTCEATSPVIRWLRTADDRQIARFEAYLKSGRLGISGFEYNTTPLCSAEQLARQFYPAQHLRDDFDASIQAVNQHDVNGVPWTMADLMIDAGIELFIMAINLHFGGAAADRPGIFRWQAPSGRELLVMNGNHYTMFDQLLYTWDDRIERMQEGWNEYLQVLESLNYPHNFLYLTATNPPQMWDNAPPNIKVAELIRAWNEAGMQPPIRFVTPAELLDHIRQIPREALPVYRGDWTDYWNFGSASTADETRRNQNAKPVLFAAELLRALRPSSAPDVSPDAAVRAAAQRAWDALNLYDEHTWGAAASVSRPDHPHTRAQNRLKLIHAYEASELAQYLLGNELEALAHNPPQADSQEGVLLVNPTPLPVETVFPVPDAWLRPGKRLRTNSFTPMWTLDPEAAPLYGPVTLPPFSWRTLRLDELTRAPESDAVQSGEGFIENAAYRLEYTPENGRITRLHDRVRDWEVLPPDSDYAFFEFIHEQPDPRIDSRRTAMYRRDMHREKVGLSCWQTDWVARRSGTDQLLNCEVVQTSQAVTLIRRYAAPGVDWLEQRLSLHADSAFIDLEVRLMKQDVRTPEATYFVIPLNLGAGWESHFDSAGLPLRLDADQLPGACRDWVTVESFASVHDDRRGAILCCPDAPMVQIGDFNFGRKQAAIPREANPLLLAWPLNNYWDTNFAASQSGLIQLRYRFGTHAAFDPAWAMQQGRAAAQDVLVHPVLRGSQAEAGTLFQVDDPHVQVLHVKPAANGAGLLLRLINVADDTRLTTLTFPGRTVTRAALTSPTEVDQLPVNAQGDHIEVPLPARQIMSVRVMLA
ncbi:MAG: hypothetical protein K8J31_25500 [Anaerolineae bacterium]|nr:hypothetical protein [Anaerolineae bacterium]